MDLVGQHHIPSQEDVDGRQGTTGKLEAKRRTKTIRNITKDIEGKKTNRVTRKKHIDREED